MGAENTEVKWSGREDLNLRPPAPKAGALPGCATPRPVCQAPQATGWTPGCQELEIVHEGSRTAPAAFFAGLGPGG